MIDPKDLSPEQIEELKGQILELEAQYRDKSLQVLSKAARRDLIAFTRLLMPDPDDWDDVHKSRYQVKGYHRLIAAALEEVERGEVLRLIITMPPRAGKSQLVSRMFPPWFLGQDGYRNIIFATYNSDFAKDFGREVKAIMEEPRYQQIFPGLKLQPGAKSASLIKTNDNGNYVAVGRGGAITGRGADLLLIDDPIKDREEADSQTIREKLWSWFTQVALSRLMSAGGRCVIVMTRWHADDLVGRLTDPENVCYDPEEAAQWKVLDLKALAGDDDPLGRKKDEALWPERFPKSYLEGLRRIDPRGFSALYQGEPSPESGDFFRAEWLDPYTYQRHELPSDLRKYCGSDHAVATRQTSDRTACLPVGIDDEHTIWVLPDAYWQRANTEQVVEAMIQLIQRHKFLLWWAEKGHITQSIGPFLRRRMNEAEAFCAMDDIHPSADKLSRAQSIQARISMGKVRFPAFAPWWPQARNELLRFPSGTHDDFVDALSMIGLGLAKQVSPRQLAKDDSGIPKTGTLGWVKWASRQNELQAKRAARVGDF